MRCVSKVVGVLLAASVFLVVTALCAMASDNPFESGGLDFYVGEWVNAQEESVLVLLPEGVNGLQGAISRKADALTLRVSLFQGTLSGDMIQGTESFPVKITRKGDNLTVEAGAWSVDLVPAKSTSFEGLFKKDDFEIQLNKGVAEYNGGIRMNGKVYILDAKARQGALWGDFSMDGESWPFFLYRGLDGLLSFHTGQFVLNGIRSKAEADKVEAAQKAEEQALFDKIKKNDLHAAVDYLQTYPHGHFADQVRKMQFHVVVKEEATKTGKDQKPSVNRWVYTRDKLGQVVQRVWSNGEGKTKTRTTTYVSYGNIDTIKGSNGYREFYKYDDEGHNVYWERHDSSGTTTDTCTYDDNGKLVQDVWKTARDNTYTTKYDGQERKTYVEYDGGCSRSSTWYTYGANGQLATMKKRSTDCLNKTRNNLDTYTYDAQGRKIKMVSNYSSGGNPSSYTYSYPSENKEEELYRDGSGGAKRTTREYDDYGNRVLLRMTKSNGDWWESRSKYEYQTIVLEGVL